MHTPHTKVPRVAGSIFGFSFCSALALVFITLKLCGVISWSWWWVLAPLYGPSAILLAAVLLYVLVAIILVGLVRFVSKLSVK
jgi:hypothetical protein